MLEIRSIEFENNLLPLIRQIFSTENPYQWCFQSSVEKISILHDYVYIMPEQFLRAVTSVATKFGETKFYVSLYNGHKYSSHWQISFNEVDKYLALEQHFVPSFYSVTYSEAGKWVILGSDEHFGLLSSNQRFYDELKLQLPDLDDQILGFIEEWRYNKRTFNSDITWITDLITKAYEPSSANKFLTLLNSE
jgi:hypothetical protein